jgi:GxxExxY protein
MVEESVIVETKSVIALTPLHRAQLITYLRLGDFPIGLLLNFNALRLKDGIVRLVNAPDLSLTSPSHPLRGPP